jgi:hypothetical protein
MRDPLLTCHCGHPTGSHVLGIGRCLNTECHCTGVNLATDSPRAAGRETDTLLAEARKIAGEQREISDDVLRLTRGMPDDATLPMRVATIRCMCRIIAQYARAVEGATDA